MTAGDQLVLTIEDGAFASDGGSIALSGRDAAGEEHTIVLWQHLFTEDFEPTRRPGRLYLDGVLVAVRSEQEQQLLEALRRARLAVASTAEPAPSVAFDSEPGMTVGRDIEAYHDKIREGPAAATAHLISELVDYVESEAYVKLARELSLNKR